MQGEALRPGTKLCRLMGGAAVAEDPPLAVCSSPAAARDGVTKGLGTGRTKKGAESTSDREKSRGRSEERELQMMKRRKIRHTQQKGAKGTGKRRGQWAKERAKKELAEQKIRGGGGGAQR